MKQLPRPPTEMAVDVTVLAELIGDDDPETLRDLLLVFQRSATAIAAELMAAGTAGNLAQVQHLAHKLKSPARTSGALALGECCAALELAAQTGSTAHALAPLLAELAAEMTAVEQALLRLLAELGTR
jgi:HPt (histidine-containing phosphotransfer) domain-containing protein